MKSFPHQIEFDHSLGWFLGPRGTTSRRETLVANLFPDHVYNALTIVYVITKLESFHVQLGDSRYDRKSLIQGIQGKKVLIDSLLV